MILAGWQRDGKIITIIVSPNVQSHVQRTVGLVRLPSVWGVHPPKPIIVRARINSAIVYNVIQYDKQTVIN